VCGELAEPDHYNSGPCKGKDGHSTRLNVCVCIMVVFILLLFPLWLPFFLIYRLYRCFRPKEKKVGFKYTGDETADHVTVDMP
jgi:hypothetical protein